MRVILTGSNGFIGGYVSSYLRSKGCEVIGVDLGDEAKKQVDSYIKCDLKTEATGELIKKTGKVDAIVHLASDMRHEPYGVEIVGNNCVGVQRLIELCEAEKVPVFVQLSSLPVIGTPIEHPITEEHPLRPPTVYHVTKCTQELLANYAYYTFGQRTVSFRICAPVGVGVNPKTIFSVFVKNAVNGDDIVLYGKGTRKQTYIHVLDIAQAIYKAIISKAHGVYNLASNNLISNKDLAEMIIKETGSSSKIVFSGNPDPLDGVIWDISIEKAKRDMGYEPEIGLKQPIRELADVFRKEAGR